MSLLSLIIIFSFLGGVFSLVGGVSMLVWKERIGKCLCELTSFAAGVLIVISTLDLLPEAFEMGEANLVAWAMLSGIGLLFLMEKTSMWFHHHHEPHGRHPEIAGVFIGDSLHNFIDGVAIGAAFLVDVKLGIATALAVGMHELPQEIADFSLYIRAGLSKARTIILNLISSLATLIGSVGVYFLGDVLAGWEGMILALTAGMFLYIALADLVPELHEVTSKKESMKHLVFIFLGGGLAYLSIKLLAGH